MKNNDCLFSVIKIYVTLSGWLIQKVNNPIETNETISCACCHIVCDNSGEGIKPGTNARDQNPGPNFVSRIRVLNIHVSS